ncbi:recombinase family protein [Rhodococcus erythropolis]|uniref:recombinase family protein n=1 Tax=Rhodococcus erythropolis TaxID=1833 RepID=UPI0029494382|nr:recombinase family protein [Rhodococcus erythropolis]MDV6278394.1 recombinase family protein [Rhodococcus erythropolis]
MLIGYARVSSTDQNPDHQVDALRRAGVAAENIHLDHASGAKSSRPQLDLVQQRLRADDVLVITPPGPARSVDAAPDHTRRRPARTGDRVEGARRLHDELGQVPPAEFEMMHAANLEQIPLLENR